VSAALILVAAYLLGSIPFSNLFARRLRDVDLREVGTGTV
jgi:glycerol-3-phosphate acyltransferase PlsY